jgi:hypothetical protein
VGSDTEALGTTRQGRTLAGLRTALPLTRGFSPYWCRVSAPSRVSRVPAGSFLRHRPSEGNQSANPTSVLEWRTPIYANGSATNRKANCRRSLRSVGRRAYALVPDRTRERRWLRPFRPIRTGARMTLSSNAPSDNEPPNVPCPHCMTHVVKPVSVSTRKGDPTAVDVKMLCTECNHIWVVQKLTHDDPPI